MPKILKRQSQENSKDVTTTKSHLKIYNIKYAKNMNMRRLKGRRKKKRKELYHKQKKKNQLTRK